MVEQLVSLVILTVIFVMVLIGGIFGKIKSLRNRCLMLLIGGLGSLFSLLGAYDQFVATWRVNPTLFKDSLPVDFQPFAIVALILTVIIVVVAIVLLIRGRRHEPEEGHH